MKVLLYKIRISYTAIGKFMLTPKNLLLMGLISVVALTVILWIFNIELLAYIAKEAPLTFLEKIWFLISILGSIYTNFETIMAASLILFSVLFAINLLALRQAIKLKTKQKVATGASTGSFVAAIVGAGCAACGTSILSPLLYGLGASSTVVLSQRLGIIINILSIGLILFSIYHIGKLLPIKSAGKP